jgi:hypothetical protein
VARRGDGLALRGKTCWASAISAACWVKKVVRRSCGDASQADSFSPVGVPGRVSPYECLWDPQERNSIVFETSRRI